jgi:signal transduction histidine kinase
MTQTELIAPRRQQARRGWLQRLGVDSAYVLTGLPIAIVSFVVVVTGISLGAGLLITFVGIPLLVATWYAARWFAQVERTRLRWAAGHEIPEPVYRTRSRGGILGWFGVLRDGQAARDVVHALLILPVATFTWSVALTWWAVAPYGLFWPLFGHTLDAANDPDSKDLPQLLGITSYAGRSWFYVGLGAFALVTLPFVLRGLTAMQTAFGRALLVQRDTDALRERIASLTASKEAAAEAEVGALRRLERDLHDGPQQRLLRVAMDLGSVQRRLEHDPESATPLVGEALVQTQEAIAELRALSRGIAPPVLADRGLNAALAAVAARATVRVDLDVRLREDERIPFAVENAAYFVVTESLTNVAKHSGATTCTVVIEHVGTNLVVTVEDDGVGGAHVAKGHGLAGLADRAAALEGSFDVTSPAGGPTRLVATLPCASS